MHRETIVIGGGVAGLECARELHRADRDVLVLERARGVGGRCATRHFEGQPIDFGPLFLHGRTESFLQAAAAVEGAAEGDVWPLRILGQGQPCQPGALEGGERRVALPAGMNTFPRHLAMGLDVRLRTRAERLSLDGGDFAVQTEAGERFTCRDLVLALALEETQTLLRTLDASAEVTGLLTLLGMFASVPSLTVLAAYAPTTGAPDWDILYPGNSEVLQLAAQDSRKRDRPDFLTLVIQGKPRWSREWLDAPEESWRAALLEATAAEAGAWVTEPIWTSCHRWLHARVDRGNELARPLLVRLRSGQRLGLAGDIFAPGGGVQAAWLSGSGLAQRFLTEET